MAVITYYSSLLITHYSLLVTHYSLLITHYSLLVTRYSLLCPHRYDNCLTEHDINSGGGWPPLNFFVYIV